jgi:hypothetical protein
MVTEEVKRVYSAECVEEAFSEVRTGLREVASWS